MPGLWRHRQGEQSRPGGQVSGDLRQDQPGLVDRELSGREPSQPAVLGVADAVFDAGVGTMPGFEEGELSDLGVGDERLVAPPVGLFEKG